MKNKTLWIGGGAVGAILLWWFVWRTPQEGATTPPVDNTFPVDPNMLPPPGEDPGAYQNTTNDTSTSQPVLDVAPPAPVVTPSNSPAPAASSSPFQVKIDFNTSNEAAPTAMVSAKDMKVIQDRVKVTPVAVAPRGGGPGSGSTHASRMATEKQAFEKQKPVVIIGIGDLVWG